MRNSPAALTNKISSVFLKRVPLIKSLYHTPFPPSFPPRPGPPILIGSLLEVSPMAENLAALWTGEELTNRRTSFAQHPATTADGLDAT